MGDAGRLRWRPRRAYQWVGLLVFTFTFGFALLGVFLPVYASRGLALALVENIGVGIVSGALLGGLAAGGVWMLGGLIASTTWWSWLGLLSLAAAGVGIAFVVPNRQTDALDLGIDLGGLLVLASFVAVIMKAAQSSAKSADRASPRIPR